MERPVAGWSRIEGKNACFSSVRRNRKCSWRDFLPRTTSQHRAIDWWRKNQLKWTDSQTRSPVDPDQDLRSTLGLAAPQLYYCCCDGEGIVEGLEHQYLSKRIKSSRDMLPCYLCDCCVWLSQNSRTVPIPTKVDATSICHLARIITGRVDFLGEQLPVRAVSIARNKRCFRVRQAS
jgi:hypothetical protein